MPDTVTPMMRQYRRIKESLPLDVILFFRLGDFYEMFYEDARRAAPILDITLTQRNGVPMCGVPFHALDSYLARIIRAGLKVAICDQMEDPESVRGIVKREITRVVTPGTVTESTLLESHCHNYLAGVTRGDDAFGVAFLDLSTGLFWGEEVMGADALRDVLQGFAPHECIVPSEQADDPDIRRALGAETAMIHLTSGDDWTFDAETAGAFLCRHFGVHSLDGLGCADRPRIIGAAGATLFYVRENLHRDVGHVRSFRVRNRSECLVLDETTCRNLDLVPTRGRGGPATTLLQVLDVTRTAMGARLLRDWLLRPLTSRDGIVQRHDAVGTLVADRSRLRALADLLAGIRDLERLIARIAAGSGTPRDVVAVASSLDAVPRLRDLVIDGAGGRLDGLGRQMEPLPELVDLIRRALEDEPPVTLKEGGVIRKGYSAELDVLRSAATESRKWLVEYQTSEQSRTGIRTLKIRHNKVFGYYIEISRGQLAHVPETYVRKQTLVNAERFITPELKDYENRILGAQERGLALEQELFRDVRERAAAETAVIQRTAAAVAELDALCSLADRALALRYVRPVMTDGDVIRVKNGRHPVLDQMPDAERFVPNDTLLDGSENQLIIITGPNMAGKSTYIRQVAMLVVMAHMGSFVPADEAEIGLTDRVFTRVGASDDLARGRSTFMVEMQETANILNNATPRSLIVLDEIGRGTSTFDGISIAWAVAEYLHNRPSVKAKTLFATHYHELTDLALTMPGVKNYNVLVRERGDAVVFLRKIVPGAADKSYGIQVARLAGLPGEVVDRAGEILANLEEGELGETGQPKIARRRGRKSKDDSTQLSLFR